MTKIVINVKFGGFSISDVAYERLIELSVPVQQYYKQKRNPDTLLYEPEPRNDGKVIYDRTLTPENQKEEIDKLTESNSLFGRYWDTWIDEDRSNPLLVQVVEELGDKANNRYSKLKVVEIPDDVEWEIDEYDGNESIHEKHRVWL